MAARLYSASGDHEQMRELFALGFQASAEASSYITAEGKTEQCNRQTGMFFPQPSGSSFNIVYFTAGYVVSASAGADAAIIETLSNQTSITGGALQGRNDFLKHCLTLDRFRVADQRQAQWLKV